MRCRLITTAEFTDTLTGKRDVVARYFEEEDRFVDAVKRGEAALERGEFLTHQS
jgi:predicted transcriptional regulator